jgi:glutaredoxin 3
MNVEIYGVEGCTFCKKAVEWCEEKDIKHTYHDVTNATELIDQLIERIGYVKTVPQIFINDKHIGGYDELVKTEVAA